MFRLKATRDRPFTMQISTALLTFLAALLLWNVPAHAHKVTIFAWVEGDMVHTQSKFSGGRRVKNAPVEVYDAQGKKLLEGRTDERGQFAFKSPGKGPLRIVLIAAMGHKAHWTLSAKELAESADTPEPATAGIPSAGAGTDSSSPPTSATAETKVPAADVQAAVQEAVEKALDKKLKPVIELLVDAQNPDPSFRDIMGGIGYILGLVGVGAYFNFRRKSK
jgi:nickel transport protein